jgi:carbon-monoxide dehydrogenase medium subunit
MWNEYITPSSIDEVVSLLSEKQGRSRIVAGATDLILEIERGVRSGIETLIDISRLPDLDGIRLDENDFIHLGPLTTHNQCAASQLIRQRAYPLARAAWEVGAPQIRNRGTIAGNLITASPANDTITPLVALDASVTLRSERGTRTIPLRDFYIGVRRTVMEPDEMMVDISFPGLKKNQRGTFIKLALRRAQAISIVNAAVVLDFKSGVIKSAAVSLGSVAPTIIHASKAEQYLVGKSLNETNIHETAKIAMGECKPIDDMRGSADYRREMVKVCVSRSLTAIMNKKEDTDFPSDPVLLWGSNHKNHAGTEPGIHHNRQSVIKTTINGKSFSFSTGQDKTLLRLLREEAGLIGTKEGCAEGECGACTVFLDGMAVMACLVPAPRAHGAEIITIEGLAQDGKLHPVQEEFIRHGAVQCGYCTPGFIMSGAKLLEEREHPERSEIEQAITGNLCRCTGYYKILEAIEAAGQNPS